MKVGKVLLVEDYPMLQAGITDALKFFFGESTVVLVAGTVAEAEKLFAEHSTDTDLILMDTCLSGTVTFDLTRKISLVFDGMIVATSSVEDYLPKMKAYGCTHACYKADLHAFLKDLANQAN